MSHEQSLADPTTITEVPIRMQNVFVAGQSVDKAGTFGSSPQIRDRHAERGTQTILRTAAGRIEHDHGDEGQLSRAIPTVRTTPFARCSLLELSRSRRF